MNINNLLKQAQSLKKNMENVQKSFSEIDVIHSSNGVSMTMNLKYEVKKITIAPELNSDLELLEDLIKLVFNQLKQKVDESINDQYSKNGIPNMF